MRNRANTCLTISLIAVQAHQGVQLPPRELAFRRVLRACEFCGPRVHIGLVIFADLAEDKHADRLNRAFVSPARVAQIVRPCNRPREK